MREERREGQVRDLVMSKKRRKGGGGKDERGRVWRRKYRDGENRERRGSVREEGERA